MLSPRTSFAPLLLTMISGGCDLPTESLPSPSAIVKPAPHPPLAGNMWVLSDDGKLALRLSVISQRVSANENIQAVAQIRNTSQQKIVVFRPFGDWYAARSVGIKIWDGDGHIRYTGPTPDYVIGADSFAVVGPGEVVEDKLELTTDNFAGIEPPGRYTLRYDYSYNGEWDATAAAGESVIRDAWRGTISSREVQVVRE